MRGTLLRRSPACTPGWVWALAFALLAAQGFAHWHRVAHAVPLVSAQTSIVTAADDAFGHAAADEAQCRLFDAMGSSAGPWSGATATPALPLQALLQFADTATSGKGCPWRPYQARGPPRA